MPCALSSRTFLVASFLLATLTITKKGTAFARRGKDLTDRIIHDLVTQERRVLMFALIKNRFLFIVGSARSGPFHEDGVNYLNDSWFFDQNFNSIRGVYARLKKPEHLLKQWPYLAKRSNYHHYNFFAVSDSKALYIIAVDCENGNLLFQNIKTRYTDEYGYDNVTRKFLAQEHPLSTSNEMTCYYISLNDPLEIVEAHFNGSLLSKSRGLQSKRNKFYLCQATKKARGREEETIFAQSEFCQMPVQWNVKVGWVGSKHIILIDQFNSIRIFSTSVLTSGKIVHVPVTRILPGQFFTRMPESVTNPEDSAFSPVALMVLAIIIGLCVCIICFCFVYNDQKNAKLALEASKLRKKSYKPPPFGNKPTIPQNESFKYGSSRLSSLCSRRRSNNKCSAIAQQPAIKKTKNSRNGKHTAAVSQMVVDGLSPIKKHSASKTKMHKTLIK